MQTGIALSTTEAEYISLSQILEVSSVFEMKFDACNSYTTTFEDSKEAIELAK